MAGKKKKKGKANLYWIFQSLIFLFILAGILLLLNSGRLPWGRNLQTLQMEQKIQSMQELVTVNQVFRDVIYREEKRFISDKRVLFSIEFHLKAGVPLDNARVNFNAQGIPVVHLPSARILSIDADERSIEQIFVREQFAQIHQSDYMEVLIKEKERLEQEALERGILSEAEAQLKLILQPLFRMAGYSEVLFQIEESL